LKGYQYATFSQWIQSAESGAASRAMINNLIRVDFLARAYFHIDKSSLPESILDD
jgi:hypothetical protein